MATKKQLSSKFKGLLADMKRQPKDKNGKFKDRDFAKYVSRNLGEIRKFAKPFKKKSKQLTLKFKSNARKKSKS